ncbi:MAG: AAC(3) family N-acetyltransferase [Clostridia bacterium]|nr:AAC(3) family N-acetyltransferase [Clostridia bacterium]
MGLDLPAGFPIIMHTSLRAVGKLEGGAEMLLELLIDEVTKKDGVLIIPTHTWDNLYTDNITLDLTKREANLGAFPLVALNRTDGLRTDNPTHSAVMFGNREMIDRLADGEFCVDTPTSPESLYGKLYREGGYVLLVGVDQNSNTYLHSVEEMLNFPDRMVADRTKVSVKYKDGTLKYTSIRLFDESVHGDVSHKFYKYEPAFRYHGAIKDGKIGSAKVQLCSCVRMKEVLELLGQRAPAGDPLLFEGEIPEKLFLNKCFSNEL